MMNILIVNNMRKYAISISFQRRGERESMIFQQMFTDWGKYICELSSMLMICKCGRAFESGTLMISFFSC